MFENIKILLQKKNKYFDSRNLELIARLRIFIMILMTIILFAEVLSDEIENERRRQQKSFIVLKVEDTHHPLLNKIATRYLKRHN